MRKTLVIFGLVTLLLLAGCSQVLPQQKQSAGVTQIDAPSVAVVGGEYTVEAELIGTSVNGNQEITMYVDGEPVQTETVSMGESQTMTMTFSHTFEETGEYEVRVMDKKANVTVVNLGDAIKAAEANMDTYRTEYSIELDEPADSEGRPTLEVDGTGEYDMDSEQSYTSFDVLGTYQGRVTTDRTQEIWHSGGLEYEKAQDAGLEPKYYTREDEFSGELPVKMPLLVTLVERGEYEMDGDTVVYTVNAQDTDDVEEIFGTVGARKLGYASGLHSDELDGVTLTVRVDANTGLLQSTSVEGVIPSSSGADGYVKMTHSYSGHGEDVAFDIPMDKFEQNN